MSWFTKSDQFTRGKNHENDLDRYFRGKGFTVTQTSYHEERELKIGDRLFEKDGQSYYVEYKSDESASRTGNAFIETISVDTDNVPGWAYTCKADYIFYYLPLDNRIYVYTPHNIQSCLTNWKKHYPTRPTSKGQNKGYNTHGVLVPIKEFGKRAEKIIEVKHGN